MAGLRAAAAVLHHPAGAVPRPGQPGLREPPASATASASPPSKPLELPAGRQVDALAAVRQRIDEDTEASLLGTNELKWASAAWSRGPPLAVRLALALWAEARHSWHRLAGTYDTPVLTGTRLTPVQLGAQAQQQG